jgi:cytochrome c biogenesis protein CcmG/thiol:disulfide interchange protein DsbE
MNWKIAIGLGGTCALLVAVLFASFGRDPHAVPFMLEGKPAPEFSLARLDNGETVTLSKLRGRPVVINFWASWCGPCVEEQPVMVWAAQELKDQAQFLGVVFEDSPENALRFLQQYGGTMPQLVDPRSQMAVDYGTSGVPETYFIDAEGIIRGKHVGPIDMQTLRADLKALGDPAKLEAIR